MVAKIKKYLSCKDNRFCITVQDNCSNDGTYEKLQEIKDDRFRLRQNKEKIGIMPNSRASLSDNADAEYLFYSIDKDYIDVNELPAFLDFLENEKPYFGFTELYRHEDTYEKYNAGIDNIKKFGRSSERLKCSRRWHITNDRNAR